MKDEGTAQPLLRAGADDLRRINAGVAAISEIHRQLRDGHPDLMSRPGCPPVAYRG